MNDTFAPTYLYIKHHTLSGKLYFGKTIGNPIKYNGSGKYWNMHIKKHGKEYVETLWYCLFLDEDSIKEFSINFSIQENIVESKQWANLVNENGINSGSFGLMISIETRQRMSDSHKGNTNLCGHKHSDKTKQKMSENRLGKCHTEESKKKMSLSQMGNTHNLGKKFTEIHKQRMSESGKKRPYVSVICPYCNKTGHYAIMKRWHFDNCKSLVNGDLNAQ